jgi:hypothetical protein
MKTYSVLFAEDVPHCGSAEIEAAEDAAAIETAKADEVTAVAHDPDWSWTVCRRIVHIENRTAASSLRISRSTTSILATAG